MARWRFWRRRTKADGPGRSGAVSTSSDDTPPGVPSPRGPESRMDVPVKIPPRRKRRWCASRFSGYVLWAILYTRTDLYNAGRDLVAIYHDREEATQAVERICMTRRGRVWSRYGSFGVAKVYTRVPFCL